MHKTFFLLFLLIASKHSNAQTNFPPYRQVVDRVLRSLDTVKLDLNSTTKLCVEKKADGFWVGISNYDYKNFQYNISQKQLCWSPEKGFLVISFQNTKEKNNPAIYAQDFRDPPSYFPEVDPFNIHPFYGYNGWYHDVIQHYTKLKKKQALTDKETYSLARAYSDYAEALISEKEHSVYYLPSDRMVNDSLKPSQERKKNFLKYKDLAISYFKKTRQLNPSFQTIVGNIHTKYSNEIMVKYQRAAFLEIATLDANNLKKEDLYDKDILAFSKNLLKSCPMNAVLFTEGDNDTYPLEYLQLKENYRRDVLVLNISLLNVWRYIDLYRTPYSSTNPLVLEVEPSAYYKSNNDYILLADKQGTLDAINFTELISQPLSNKKINTFQSKSIEIPFSDLEQMTLVFNGNYLLKNQIIALLAILAQADERPFCFSQGLSLFDHKFTKDLGIKQYLHPHGFVSILRKKTNSEIDIEQVEKNYDLFTKELKWHRFNKIPKGCFASFNQYKYSILFHARLLYNYDMAHLVEDVLDSYLEYFPINGDEEFSYNEYIQFIDLYLKAENKKKAAFLAKETFDLLATKEKLTDTEFNALKQIDNLLQQNNIQDYNKIIQELYSKPKDINPWNY